MIDLIACALTEKEAPTDLDMSGIYSTKADWGAQFRAPTTLQTFNPIEPVIPNTHNFFINE